MCTHRGPFDGQLVCTATDPGHDQDAPTGHTYASTSGVPDRHDKPGRGDGE